MMVAQIILAVGIMLVLFWTIDNRKEAFIWMALDVCMILGFMFLAPFPA